VATRETAAVAPHLFQRPDALWSAAAKGGWPAKINSMPEKVRIALDVMGGDFGAPVVVAGADISLARHGDIEFVMVGDQAVIGPLLADRPTLRGASRVVHTTVSVAMDAKPSQALRHGRWRSSMWMAIDAVKRGDADVAISAGNTGALMGMTKFHLKTMPGIDRPTMRGESIVLDLGASIGADAKHLIDLAVMGGAMARVVFNIERPTIGLLNIGVEEVKGLEEVREAGAILRAANRRDIEYAGFVEGDDIGKGTVDVVVTEGFAGNIALKTAEGTAKQLGDFMRRAMSRSLFAKIGYLFARNAFAAVKDKMDPRKVNGGVFLGLNGVVIKSHGATDAEGFSAAVDMGYDMVRRDLRAKLSEMLARPSSEPAHAGAEKVSS
jgi:glycerol-3-phosphate acyltransferase PlsX